MEESIFFFTRVKCCLNISYCCSLKGILMLLIFALFLVCLVYIWFILFGLIPVNNENADPDKYAVESLR